MGIVRKIDCLMIFAIKLTTKNFPVALIDKFLKLNYGHIGPHVLKVL